MPCHVGHSDLTVVPDGMLIRGCGNAIDDRRLTNDNGRLTTDVVAGVCGQITRTGTSPLIIRWTVDSGQLSVLNRMLKYGSTNETLLLSPSFQASRPQNAERLKVEPLEKCPSRCVTGSKKC